jgi:hypothetical protein
MAIEAAANNAVIVLGTIITLLDPTVANDPIGTLCNLDRL